MMMFGERMMRCGVRWRRDFRGLKLTAFQNASDRRGRFLRRKLTPFPMIFRAMTEILLPKEWRSIDAASWTVDRRVCGVVWFDGSDAWFVVVEEEEDCGGEGGGWSGRFSATTVDLDSRSWWRRWFCFSATTPLFPRMVVLLPHSSSSSHQPKSRRSRKNKGIIYNAISSACLPAWWWWCSWFQICDANRWFGPPPAMRVKWMLLVVVCTYIMFSLLLLLCVRRERWVLCDVMCVLYCSLCVLMRWYFYLFCDDVVTVRYNDWLGFMWGWWTFGFLGTVPFRLLIYSSIVLFFTTGLVTVTLCMTSVTSQHHSWRTTNVNKTMSGNPHQKRFHRCITPLFCPVFGWLVRSGVRTVLLI